MEYSVIIYEDWETYDNKKIYVYGYNADYKSFYFTVKDGVLVAKPREEGERAKEPFLTLSTKFGGDKFLQAFAEGLKKSGFVVEVDNTQRISAEALNREKDEQISWLRQQIEKQL